VMYNSEHCWLERGCLSSHNATGYQEERQECNWRHLQKRGTMPLDTGMVCSDI